MRLSTVLIALSLAALTVSTAAPSSLERGPRKVTLDDGRSFTVTMPTNFDLRVAAQGLGRTRFMAKSPDGRIFVTDMFDRTDNTKGKVYALSNFDASSGKFQRVTTYLSGLHNPNSLTFHTDRAGRNWLYLALTDKLLRYRFTPGELKPSAASQTLATFPAYGLSYKYGGWHLTRTVVVGPDERVYVSVGSSCNACVEKEAIRASVVVMDLDGKNQRPFATGLRNAVGLHFVGNQLYATNMGADHLGDGLPNDQLYALQDRANYGWPYCYVKGTRAQVDQKYNPNGVRFNCAKVPAALTGLPAHAAPLGLEYFGSGSAPELRDSFLVALHGSGFIRIGTGYALWRVARSSGRAEPFMDGFLKGGKILGRPVDVLAFGTGFLMTDDSSGVVYFVQPRANR